MAFNYSTLNNKHIKQDPCIQLRNLQTHTSDSQKPNQKRYDSQPDSIDASLEICECSTDLIVVI